MELLGQESDVLKTLTVIAKLPSVEVRHISLPMRKMRVPISSQRRHYSVLSTFWPVANLIGEKIVYHGVILICISLILNEVVSSHLHLRAICVSLH